MIEFTHPRAEDFSLPKVLAALGDPIRLDIVRRLAADKSCKSCSEAAPESDIAKSTLSHHFRILREAGIIYTEKRGVEHRNVVRLQDLNRRFPGLLGKILKLGECSKKT